MLHFLNAVFELRAIPFVWKKPHFQILFMWQNIGMISMGRKCLKFPKRGNTANLSHACSWHWKSSVFGKAKHSGLNIAYNTWLNSSGICAFSSNYPFLCPSIVTRHVYRSLMNVWLWIFITALGGRRREEAGGDSSLVFPLLLITVAAACLSLGA